MISLLGNLGPKASTFHGLGVLIMIVGALFSVSKITAAAEPTLFETQQFIKKYAERSGKYPPRGRISSYRYSDCKVLIETGRGNQLHEYSFDMREVTNVSLSSSYVTILGNINEYWGYRGRHRSFESFTFGFETSELAERILNAVTHLHNSCRPTTQEPF
jgi:hypothetical protein